MKLTSQRRRVSPACLVLLLALTLGQLLGQGSAQVPSAPSVDALTPAERAALEAELSAWKNSPAGVSAAQMGLAPGSPGSARSLRLAGNGAIISSPKSQLERFLAGKKTVEQLSRAHPQTRFSMQTPFALLTKDEFAAFVKQSNVPAQRRLMESRMLGSGNFTQQQQSSSQLPTTPPPRPAPKEVDWQKEGCVTRVKNQGTCGVCWVFAAIGALESGYCINSGTKMLTELSEQDVVSCGPNKGECYGGFASVAYDWIIKKNGGTVCTEATAPYTYGDSDKKQCKRYDDPSAKCDRPNLGLVSYVTGQYSNHEDLEKVVAQRPVAAQLRSGVPMFQFYSGGLLMGNEAECPSTTSDHEITIVGYGERNGTKYWKIKNSWGTFWGEDGYGYLERGYQGGEFGTCGVENWSYYPVFRSQAPWTEGLRCQAERRGVELLGKDLKTVTVRWTTDCCDVCRREPGCKAAVWSRDDWSKCILKATIDGERVDPELKWSSVVVGPKKTGEMCLPTEDNVDYYGEDISRTLVRTAEECCDICTQTRFCGAYTWTNYMGGTCFLKYSKSKPEKKNALPDGTPYFRSGQVYRCQPLQKNVDFPGEDFANRPAKQATECCALCWNNDQCSAFSWSDYQGGTCWLKRKASGSTKKIGVVSATL